MGRLPGEERACEWSFTESLTLDDVELRERQVLEEDGEMYMVTFAYSIQGRETAKITYKELRKVCAYLGVRYYKNRSKDTMTELIAQKKLKGEVPEEYKFVKKSEKKKAENQDPEANNRQRLITTKRQRTTTDNELEAVTTPTITTSSTATHTFLQPMSPTLSERQSPSEGFDSGISTTPSPTASRIPVEMSLTDRTDTFTLLCHVRQQIRSVENEIVAHTESNEARISTVKTQRLTHDLQFYLSERRALMQQLEHSRFQV
ncbi:hypothetical protein PRNP1_005933 [Phytophthora ramorum]